MNPNNPNNSQNPYNPFGIIQGMGQADCGPFYSADGRYDVNRQAWVSPVSRNINFNHTAYLQSGYTERYPGDLADHGLHPTPQVYNDRQRAYMREQVAEGGCDFGMDEAELQAERERIEAYLQELQRTTYR
jgi:hypothetical protein